MEELKGKDFALQKEIDFDFKKKYINENILLKYSEEAAKEAVIPISLSDLVKLMPIEKEMCEKILDIWEIDKYNANTNSIINSTIMSQPEKYIKKTITGKILRLIPGGVTILSIGIKDSIARRFTLALGHAFSELSALYIQQVCENKDVDVMDVFTQDAIEDKIDAYLIEYNKTVLN